MSATSNTLASQTNSRTQSLYREAKRLIPGGTQLLSKRPEMFAPDQWPAYYRDAQGCEVTDLDGRRYIDMSIMGIGTCLLGYNDPDVSQAVIRRIQAGSMCSLNNPEEVELAKLLIEIHPWAEQVRYARTGGEAMAVAVRIARARSKRSLIAFCGYHGWHDWYLATNVSPEGAQDQLQGHLIAGLQPNGVPRELAGTAIPFRYNELGELAEIVKKHGNNLAAVVMEPTRSVDPVPGFHEGVRNLCNQCGAVLVIDEITAGWRLWYGGAHLKYGLEPDMAVFAKAISNGHPMAAIIGKSHVMEAAQETFVSSTYWTEGVGPTAALATIRKMRDNDVSARLNSIGLQFREGVQRLVDSNAIPLKLSGHPAITTLAFDHPQAPALQTLLTVRMLERGILAGGGFYASLAHRQEYINQYLEAAGDIFPELAEAISKEDVSERIKGPVKHTSFSRLT